MGFLRQKVVWWSCILCGKKNEYIASQWCHRKGVLKKGPFGMFTLHGRVLNNGIELIFSQPWVKDVWEQYRVSNTEQVFTEHSCWNVIHTAVTCWNVSLLPYPVNNDEVWKLLPKIQEDQAGDDEWHFEGSLWPVALDWMCLYFFLIVRTADLTDWDREISILSPYPLNLLALWSWVN